jgi:gliding motility-associated-like protein
MIVYKKRKWGGLLVVALWLSGAMSAQQYTVTGGTGTPLSALDDPARKIQVYLTYGMDNVRISYTSASSSHQWYRYRDRDDDRAEKVTSVREGATSYVTHVEAGYGYYVKEIENWAGNPAIWVIDYSRHAFDIRSFELSPDRDECIAIRFTGDADLKEMVYYTPAGSREVLKRVFELSYETLEWNPEIKQFSSKMFTGTFDTDPFATSFPQHPEDVLLLDTEITLRGDLFARHFGMEKSISLYYEAQAIEVYADTVVVSSGSSNMAGAGEELYAPAVVDFIAYANTPVAARFVWRINRVDEENQKQMIMQFNGDRASYTFDRAGTYVAELEVSNRSGSCADDSYSFVIQLTDTEMIIPNAFSPGCTPGINDIFKVRYKSIVKFQGRIYNRWGIELFHWADPSQGWDGMYKGKYVPAGAYHYLIEYTGTDGKKRTKKGDVNVFRSKTIDTEIQEENL